MRNISFKNASVDNSSSESIGSALTVTVLVGSVLLLLAAMAGPAPVRSADDNAALVAKPAIETVVVTATRPKHIS